MDQNEKDELTGKLNVQRFLLMDIVQEIIGNFCNGNIVDIQFIPLNKK